MRRGRPTKYRPEMVEVAQALAEQGATDQEVAASLGIHVDTLYQWRAARPEFSAALTVGKEIADARVERSLYQRAIGYEQDAVKIFLRAGDEAPIYAPYRERIAPDTTAAIFWLKNRKPAEWRDRHEIGGSLTVTIQAADADL